MKIFPLWLFAFCSLPLLAFGQGPLTPPGAPTPTMKTLDQIEARTPIPSAAVGLVPPFVINQPGSYYLTKNIAVTSGNAIQMSANGVTLDLNGFTLSSSASPAGGTAINVVSGSNLTIRNGFISGTTTVSGGTFSGGGFSAGISDQATGSTNVTVERISVRGIGGDGILLGISGTVVHSCSTNVTSGQGIVAELVTNSIAEVAGGSSTISGTTVSGCRATNISGAANTIGIHATVCTDSTSDTDNGIGISTTNGTNCSGTVSGSATSNIGLAASHNATNCTGTASTGTGLTASNAINCFGVATSGTGLSANNATNCTGTTLSRSISVFALDCQFGTATGCFASGGTFPSGALRAAIAIGCTFQGGSADITNRYNMP